MRVLLSREIGYRKVGVGVFERIQIKESVGYAILVSAIG